MKKVLRVLLAALLTMSMLAGCGQKDAPAEDKATTEESTESEKETIHIGQTSMTSSLSPLEGSNGWSLTSHGISESVYMQDKQGNLVSRFVSDIQQKDDYNWALTLKEDVYFSDGSIVDAELFSAAINELMEKNEMCAVGSAGKMTCTPTGDFTLNLETEHVTRILQSNLCEFTIIMYKNLGNGEFAYTGPYIAKSIDPGVKLEMEPNPYYQGAEKRPNVTLNIFADESSMKLAFESGEIEMASTITSGVMEMLEAQGMSTVTYDAGYQYFMYCNMEREFMKEDAVRQAINLAIDRDEMITALKGGRKATGMFATYYSFAGDYATEYNLEEAKKILEDAGWTLNKDGIREKDGKTLRLKFITYASRPDLPVLMQLAVSQLQEIGIEFKAEIVDNITDACTAGDFDLVFYAQHTASTGEPAYFLRLGFFPDSSSNFSRYNSEEFQNVVNAMGELPLGEKRDALAKEAQGILYKDLPVIYVVDPQWHIAVSDKLKEYTPYCGDYYTINSEFGLN